MKAVLVPLSALSPAERLVPFAFGFQAQGVPGGLVHDWLGCVECGRLRAEAIARCTLAEDSAA